MNNWNAPERGDMIGASDLILQVEALKPGDHLCCIYKTEEEHRALLAPYLQQGLEQNEKVVYIVDTHTAAAIIAYLESNGMDVEAYISKGQFGILTRKETYMREGSFSPDRMISLLRAETERALHEGYSALRVTGEMTWALRNEPGSQSLIEYEAKLNGFFPGSRCLAICQYDQQQFDPDILLDVLCTHPVAAIGSELHQNFYYMPPDKFLSTNVASARFQCWLQNLEGHTSAVKHIDKLLSLMLTVRDINQRLLTVKTEKRLFQDICEALVTRTGCAFVWIALVDERSGNLHPAACAGEGDGFLDTMMPILKKNSGPEHLAYATIKGDSPYIISDITVYPRFHHWQKEALKRGFRSCIALPLVHKKQVFGVLAAYCEKKEVIDDELIGFFKEVAGDISVGVNSLRLGRDLTHALYRLQTFSFSIVKTLAGVIEARDPYTGGHQVRVSQLAEAIAEKLNLTKARTEGLRMAGSIHDIGKIAVPAEILTKPGSLSPIERTLLHHHPQRGYDLVRDLDFPWPVADIILQHHERLDGSGYPQGLKEDKILPEAKILAVADVVEAMSSHRPYRPARGIDKALEEIEKGRGTLYDEAVVDACIKLFREEGFQFNEA